MPTSEEEWVIRSFLNVQQAFVKDTDFIIEEDDGMYNMIRYALHVCHFTKQTAIYFSLRAVTPTEPPTVYRPTSEGTKSSMTACHEYLIYLTP